MNGYTLYDYWFILYHRRKTILVITLSTLAFAALLSWLLPPVYQATSVFFVPAKPDSLTFFSASDPKQVARSPLVPEPRGEQQKIYLGILESEALRKKVREAFPQKTNRDLKRNTDFRSGTNFLLEVYVRDRDPQVAADLTNAYVKFFNQTLNGFSLRTSVEQRRSMERELIETQEKLGTARIALAEFQRRHPLAIVDEDSQNLTQFRTDLEKSFGETRVKLKEAARKANSLREQLAKESSLYTGSSTALTSPLVETLQEQLSDLESQIAAARANFTDSHPNVVSLRAQYDQKRRDLSREIKRVVESETKSPNSFVESLRQEMVRVVIERETLQARADGLDKGITALDGQIAALPNVRSEYQAFKRDVEQYQRQVENLRLALAEALAQEQRELKSIVVVDEASPPEQPIFPNVLLNALVALGLGLVGGVFYAYFIDYVERANLNLEADIKELEKEYA